MLLLLLLLLLLFSSHHRRPIQLRRGIHDGIGRELTPVETTTASETLLIPDADHDGMVILRLGSRYLQLVAIAPVVLRPPASPAVATVADEEEARDDEGEDDDGRDDPAYRAGGQARGTARYSVALGGAVTAARGRGSRRSGRPLAARHGGDRRRGGARHGRGLEEGEIRDLPSDLVDGHPYGGRDGAPRDARREGRRVGVGAQAARDGGAEGVATESELMLVSNACPSVKSKN
jgi:hypothetical protein